MSTNQIAPVDQPDDESRRSSSKQAASGAADGDEQSRPRASQPPLPIREDILRKLDHLPGLVAIKVLAPSQSNAMHGVYRTILDELRHSEQVQSSQIADENLIEILRANPALLKLIEPFLTTEQVNMVIREGQNHAEPDA